MTDAYDSSVILSGQMMVMMIIIIIIRLILLLMTIFVSKASCWQGRNFRGAGDGQVGVKGTRKCCINKRTFSSLRRIKTSLCEAT